MDIVVNILIGIIIILLFCLGCYSYARMIGQPKQVIPIAAEFILIFLIVIIAGYIAYYIGGIAVTCFGIVSTFIGNL